MGKYYIRSSYFSLIRRAKGDSRTRPATSWAKPRTDEIDHNKYICDELVRAMVEFWMVINLRIPRIYMWMNQIRRCTLADTRHPCGHTECCHRSSVSGFRLLILWSLHISLYFFFLLVQDRAVRHLDGVSTRRGMQVGNASANKGRTSTALGMRTPTNVYGKPVASDAPAVTYCEEMELHQNPPAEGRTFEMAGRARAIWKGFEESVCHTWLQIARLRFLSFKNAFLLFARESI